MVQRRRRGGCQPPKKLTSPHRVGRACMSEPMSGTVEAEAFDAVAFYSGAGWWVLPNRVRWFSYGRKLSGALVGWVWLLLTSQCTRLAFRLLPRSLGCCTHVRSSRAGSYAWAIWPTDLLELLKSGGFPTVGKPVEEDLSSSKFECTTSGRGCQIEILGDKWWLGVVWGV